MKNESKSMQLGLTLGLLKRTSLVCLTAIYQHRFCDILRLLHIPCLIVVVRCCEQLCRESFSGNPIKQEQFMYLYLNIYTYITIYATFLFSGFIYSPSLTRRKYTIVLLAAFYFLHLHVQQLYKSNTWLC